MCIDEVDVTCLPSHQLSYQACHLSLTLGLSKLGFLFNQIHSSFINFPYVIASREAVGTAAGSGPPKSFHSCCVEWISIINASFIGLGSASPCPRECLRFLRHQHGIFSHLIGVHYATLYSASTQIKGNKCPKRSSGRTIRDESHCDRPDQLTKFANSSRVTPNPVGSTPEYERFPNPASLTRILGLRCGVSVHSRQNSRLFSILCFYCDNFPPWGSFLVIPALGS